MDKEQFSCVGHSVPKVDALDKVLGRAVYSEDISFPDMLHGQQRQSYHAHTRI